MLVYSFVAFFSFSSSVGKKTNFSSSQSSHCEAQPKK